MHRLTDTTLSSQTRLISPNYRLGIVMFGLVPQSSSDQGELFSVLSKLPQHSSVPSERKPQV